jgi:hypothetical protein
LRDDRGNRRDHERYDRMNGDRANSPSRERQSKALEMGNHDETMQDTFAGPGVLFLFYPRYTSTSIDACTWCCVSCLFQLPFAQSDANFLFLQR